MVRTSTHQSIFPTTHANTNPPIHLPIRSSTISKPPSDHPSIKVFTQIITDSSSGPSTHLHIRHLSNELSTKTAIDIPPHQWIHPLIYQLIHPFIDIPHSILFYLLIPPFYSSGRGGAHMWTPESVNEILNLTQPNQLFNPICSLNPPYNHLFARPSTQLSTHSPWTYTSPLPSRP